MSTETHRFGVVSMSQREVLHFTQRIMLLDTMHKLGIPSIEGIIQVTYLWLENSLQIR